jgi:hypothetical protein
MNKSIDKNKIKIAKITIQILSKKPWKEITLDVIKKKVNLKNFDLLIKQKKDLLGNLNSYFDYLLSFKIKDLDESSEKDMIFEILMMRFDILQENRSAILSIFNSYKIKPDDLLILFPALLDSMILMMKSIKISTTGITGAIKLKGFFIIYILSFISWTKDSTNSLEKTMTSLDKYLDQFSKLIKFIK